MENKVALNHDQNLYIRSIIQSVVKSIIQKPWATLYFIYLGELIFNITYKITVKTYFDH